MNTPKVSVCMLTYNHEKFIAKAINSVLLQRANFEIELVIGEDFSKDNTKNIIKYYQGFYPNIIKPIYNTKNLGVGRNLSIALSSCSGKYVAFLDGDDFWIDPYKLQKQVSFLDENPDYSICCHNVKLIYNNSKKKPSIEVAKKKALNKKNQTCFSNYNGNIFAETFTIKELCSHNFIETPSCIFRNRLFGKVPNWLEKLPILDWPIHLLNAKYGKIKYIDEVMAVYRLHSGGIHSSLSSFKKLNNRIITMEKCQSEFHKKYQIYFENGLVFYYYQMIKLLRSGYYNSVLNNKVPIDECKYYPLFLKKYIFSCLKLKRIESTKSIKFDIWPYTLKFLKNFLGL